MTATEQFNFASTLCRGMRKQADVVRAAGLRTPAVETFVSSRDALKKMLLAGGVGAGLGVGASAALSDKHANFNKQANPFTEALGTGLGHIMGPASRIGGAAVNAGVAGLNMAAHGGVNAGKNLARSAWRLGTTPIGDGSFGRGFNGAYNQWMPKPRVPPMPQAAGAAEHAAESVTSNPSYLTPDLATTMRRNRTEFDGDPRRFDPSAHPAAPAVASTAATNAGATATAQPQPGPWRQKWDNLKPWQRGVGYGAAGYGGVTAATSPMTYANNEAADWQQQHPLMGWLGKTFGGMPDYQRKSYLRPSFLQ